MKFAHQRAYTIVEALIVLIIIVLLGTALIPTFFGHKKGTQIAPGIPLKVEPKPIPLTPDPVPVPPAPASEAKPEAKPEAKAEAAPADSTAPVAMPKPALRAFGAPVSAEK